jgi:hypothetical protein
LSTALTEPTSEMGVYDRDRLTNIVRQCAPLDAIREMFPGVTREQVRAIALDFVAELDAELELMQSYWFENIQDIPGKVRKHCEKRHALLAYAGQPLETAEARRHRADHTIKVMILAGPAGKLDDRRYGAVTTMPRFVAGLGSVALPDAARDLLLSTLAELAPAIREAILAPHFARYTAIAGALAEVEARDKFIGKGSSATVQAKKIKAEMDALRAQWHALANDRIEALTRRLERGDLTPLIEANELADAGKVALPLADREIRERIATALIAAGAERFVAIERGWPDVIPAVF